MKKIILGISLILLLTFNVQTSFGYNVTFEDWGNRIKEIPLVCILEPTFENDQHLTKNSVERLIDETQTAIGEWEAQLKNSQRSKDKSMWEINQILIPFEDQKEFEYNKCNIFVHFKDKPELESDWYKLLGKTQYEEDDTGRTNITVYYAEIKICKTEDAKFYYYDPCYGDSHRLIQQLGTVMKHEFGHALGLGHYVADDLELNIAWARGNAIPPSIMVVFTHQNFNENIITLKDIKKVRSIYGEKGFLHLQTNEELIFHSFELDQQDYIVEDSDFQIIRMDGKIYSKKVIEGIPVILEITRPDGTSDSTSIIVNSAGVFNMQKIIDSDALIGTYFAIASYRGEKSNEITFNVIKDTAINDTNEVPQIPQWLKNNAKWYGDGQMMDRDFILGIKYLIEKGFVDIPDVTVQTENQESGIPDWVRNTAKWWSEDQISDEEFTNEIKYLIENRIIKI